MKLFRILTSKTVLGAIAAAAGYLAAAPAVDVWAIVQAAGVVLGAIGARDAIAKNGNGA